MQFYNSHNFLYYPKKSTKELFTQLLAQVKDAGVIILDKMPTNLNDYDILVDAIFGFSFEGEIKEPFKSIIQQITNTKIPIVSIDIPSGWNVDKGNINHLFTPEMLISLTLPKKCAEYYSGIHYLGGRFVPNILFKKYNCEQPSYSGSDCYMRIDK